jgi:hypothetical protein
MLTEAMTDIVRKSNSQDILRVHFRSELGVRVLRRYTWSVSRVLASGHRCSSYCRCHPAPHERTTLEMQPACGLLSASLVARHVQRLPARDFKEDHSPARFPADCCLLHLSPAALVTRCEDYLPNLVWLGQQKCRGSGKSIYWSGAMTPTIPRCPINAAPSCPSALPTLDCSRRVDKKPFDRVERILPCPMRVLPWNACEFPFYGL